ncbi:MAG TPA: ATP-dependent helicase [Candidatus Acidoferrum sp.]|jgi:DNA helicase-2/ATP-dependent DNA helicase PcrA|nr:ATP-dependent helicase [Candidatus Acidoferrum sp.]
MPDPDPQQVAAASYSLNLLVIAPPGCGKTELLALRAEALIPRLQPNQRILALTFTNRAKANLSERLKRLLGTQRFRRYVTVHNFHGHAAEVVLAHGGTLGMTVEGIGMPTTKTLRKALEQFSTDAATNRASAELLATTKRSRLSDEEVIAALDEAGDALALRVEVERIAANQLHYEDLLRHAQRLLAIDEVANLYQQHYGAVLVDEFQDLSPQQLDVAMRTCATSRTFAGDPMQGIYSWAGADPERVEANLRAVCTEPIQLTVSYRSSPAVLAMLNGVSGRMGAEQLRAFDPSAWPDGGASAALAVRTTADEARLIAVLSQRMVQADPTASVGVITRSSWRRDEIDKAFGALPELPCRRWDLAIEDPAILDRLRSAVAAMPRDVTFHDARERVVAMIDPSDVDTIEQVEDAFEQLQIGTGTSVRAAINQFRVRDDDAAVGPGVHLLNAHTGKGQQFDWVFIPGLEEKHLPDRRSSAGAALDEEERVLLVMLSRARHGVVVTTATTLNGRYGSYPATVSRWWRGLASSATMDWAALDAHITRVYPPQAQQAI